MLGRTQNDFQFVVELINTLEKKEEFKVLKEYKTKLTSIENRFYRLIGELALSLKVENYGWSNRSVDKLLKTNPYELIVNPLSLGMNDAEFVEILEKLLTHYEKVTSRKTHTQMLANMFFHLGANNNYKVLVNRFNSLWPLQEVRQIIKNTLYAGEFFDFWYIHLLNRTSDNNLRTLLRSMLTKDRIQKADYSQLWIFRHYYPGEAELRRKIVNKMIAAWEGSSLANKLVVITCLENTVLKRDLAKINNYFDKPLFQIRREFFNSHLSSNIFNEYALYQLTLLGDTKAENLLKLIEWYSAK